MVRAVFFDVGGVLLRAEDQSGRRKWEQRLGLPDDELARIVWRCDVSLRAMVGQATEADVWQNVATTFKLNGEQLRELIADFFSAERADAILIQFARDLRHRYMTGVISNAWATSRQIITDKFGLSDAFDIIVLSGEEGVAKPDARIYNIALERLGLPPTEAIFVDDLGENIAAARALGMRGVQFENTPQAIAAVRSQLDGKN